MVSHHVAWDKMGLGVSCQQVHRALRKDMSFTVRELVGRTGKTDDTVRRALNRLALHGLAEKDEGGRYPRWRGTGRSLDDVAADRGIAGRDRERRLAHLEQRTMEEDRRRRYLASLRRMDPGTGEVILRD